MLSSEEIRRFMEDDGIVDGIHVKDLPAAAKLGVAANDIEAPDDGSSQLAEPDVFSAYVVSHAALSTSAMLHTMQLFSDAALYSTLAAPGMSDTASGDRLPNGPMLQVMQLSSELAAQSMSVFTQTMTGLFFGSLR